MAKNKNKFIEELSKPTGPKKNRFIESLEEAQIKTDYKMMSDYLGEYFDERDLDNIMDKLLEDYDKAFTEAATSAAANTISGSTSGNASDFNSNKYYNSNPVYNYQYVPQYPGDNGMARTVIGGGLGSINSNGWAINDASSYKTTISADEIEIDGMSLKEVLQKMQERMAILDDPSPEKLEKFEALKKAYENYKILEKLCFEKGDDEK